MVGILLLILKIIGFILIGIVSLFLLLCILVLFVPIRYELSGQKDEKILIQGRVTYLLQFIKIYFSYDGDLNYRGKILFKTIFSSEKKEAKTREKTESKEKIEPEELIKAEEKIEAEKIIYSKEITEPEEKTEPKKKIKMKTPKTKKAKKVKEESQKKVSLSKIKKALTSQEYKGVLKYVMKHFMSMLRSTLPKKLKLYLKFGTYDPALTGCLLGLISILYAIPGNSMVVEPDFEHTVISGNFKLKGRIFIFILVYHGIRIYFDKRVKKLIAEFI